MTQADRLVTILLELKSHLGEKAGEIVLDITKQITHSDHLTPLPAHARYAEITVALLAAADTARTRGLVGVAHGLDLVGELFAHEWQLTVETGSAIALDDPDTWLV